MEDLEQSRVASVVTLVGGIWIAISPIWISVTGGALTSVIILGILIALAGLVQLFWKNSVPSWISGIAAILLILSAILFSNLGTSAIWNMVVSAIVIFVIAFWDGIEVNHFNNTHNREYHLG